MPVICKMTEKLRVMSWFFRVSGSNVMCLCVDFFFCNRLIAGNAAKLVADTIHVEKNTYGQ
jgi:hypothetical protein